ncbi:MAG TPA: tyrosine-type recombinase/integrase [Trichocoleus sp.]
MAEKRKKAPKGSVVVQNFRDRLRLCWSYQGKRFYLYLGLPEGKVNRLVAEAKARVIEGDLATGNFDRTLAKYKPQNPNHSRVKVTELFEQFTQYKSKSVYQQTLAKYQAFQGHLAQHFREQIAENVTEADVEKFQAYLSRKLAPVTLREWLKLGNAAWQWGQKKGIVVSNPWGGVRVKVPPRQAPKPFTSEEIKKIVAAFRNNSEYSHYADFVNFLLGVGCRIGEAIALKWKHLSDDYSVCWIGESYSRQGRKATKTERDRFVSIPPRLQQMLQQRRLKNSGPDDLIFTSAEGCAIRDGNFRKRYWKPVLEAGGIPYRSPRNTRHTLISHALDRGMSPAAISEQTGHRIETLLRRYAGNVQGRPHFPDLLED